MIFGKFSGGLQNFAKSKKFLEVSSKLVGQSSKMPLSDLAAFRRHFEKAKNIVILTGKGQLHL
jgi:hypothetical protein